ncbi:MAG: tRNA-Thr(GGU) m(6)t(6)A37 methyltransferase TsaA [Bacteriovoracaceae bacterium]
MELKTLCHIKTPFKDKFGIPRQSGLIPEAVGILSFPNDNFHKECLRGLEGFSHLWLSFIFDKAIKDGQRSLVRPPRLGGKEKMGVWATRSPHRPNHLGLTVVKLLEIKEKDGQIEVQVGGVDLLDETPIVDIKPYVPYCDSVEASSAWVPEPCEVFKPKVHWDEGVKEKVLEHEALLIEKVLEQDPRPSAQKLDKESYVFKIFDYEVKFKNGAEVFRVTSVRKN